MLLKYCVLVFISSFKHCLARRDYLEPATTAFSGVPAPETPFSGNSRPQLPPPPHPHFPILHHDPRPPEFDAPPELGMAPVRPSVIHAGVPRGLSAYPLPLAGNQELVFNVSWLPSLGPPARDYSLELISLTNTDDCDTLMCYEYNIPGDSTWHLIPEYTTPIAETCAVRPGCAYQVRLIAHPWDGHTSSNINVELDECVSGVCSCAHAPRLPSPSVRAKVVSIQGELFINVTWSLPPPPSPQRLPPGLEKQYYFVSIGKQMVSDAHPSPWFAHTITRRVNTSGIVADGDSAQFLLVPSVERSGERSEERGEERGGDKRLVLDVKLLARVSLVDDRGCRGPAGNATAYDPTAANKSFFGAYALWAALGGACVLSILALLAVTTRVAKRVLNAFRPAAVSAPLEPLRRRSAWFSMQLRNNEITTRRGQIEQSPLYVHKQFETDEDDGDEWELKRSRVHLGALIGSGAFGRVHVATLDAAGGETITVAAKMLSENATEEELQDFLREINMLKHMGSHKHVIRLIACCTKATPLIALLEHAPRGDLLTLLQAARGRRKDLQPTKLVDSDADGGPSEAGTDYTNISDGDTPLSDGKLYVDLENSRKDHYVAEPALQLDASVMRDYALQVALGMRHLEKRGIIHRDLAARNILVDGAGVLKVADFGLSRSGIYVHTRSRPVPLRWLAPEAILHAQYCSASDVWAFAVLLWEIATLGGFPYNELSNHQVPTFIARGSRLPKPARASPRLYQLMISCWADDPTQRPTFAQIVDQLTAQKQLYVDLDSVFTSEELCINDHAFVDVDGIVR